MSAANFPGKVLGGGIGPPPRSVRAVTRQVAHVAREEFQLFVVSG
jgi:hypothetical protein